MVNTWIEVNVPFAISANFLQKTFEELGLCKAGTEIEFEDGERLIIGDINGEGGTCGCCTTINLHRIVKRYRVFNRE